MLKIKLPIEFQDGKEMYNAVLSMIHKKSPVLSKLIHDNHDYNPFSLELPNIINVLGLEIELFFREMEGIEILKEIPYKELLETRYDNELVMLQFHNTTFRMQGLDFPLPVPEKILLSLKERWNQLYPEKINITIPFPGERSKNHTIITFANIHTAYCSIGDYHPFRCFYGKVGLRAIGDEEYKHQFNVLMRFAEFAGVGHKRPMGMGVVRLLKTEVEEQE